MLTSYRDFLVESKKDKKFKCAYDELGIPFDIAKQIIELRQRRGWTQTRLAKEVNTTQSSIARLENMNQDLPSLSFLKRVTDALGAEIEVRVIAR